MPHQARITIIGLGAGAPGDITLGAWEALKTAPRILLRTGKHPVVEWLRRKGISFSTFDHFYVEVDDFQEVYRRIAEAVICAARRGPVLYAVPGHPLVAEESVRLIAGMAVREGLEVRFLPAVSFLGALFSALRLDPGTGLQVVDGLRLEEGLPLPTRPAVVMQVYSRLVASDIKLSLLEIYPPGHPVTVVRGAGIPAGERVETVPLCELDRLAWFDHLTSLYVPRIEEGKSEVGSWKEGEGDGRGARDVRGETLGTGSGKRKETVVEGQVFGDGEDLDEPEDVEVIQVYEGKDSVCNDEYNIGDGPGGYSCDGVCRFPLDPLVDVLARLRGEDGCPWDREQDHRTLRPYLIEEAYEVLEALDEEDMHKICEELGDLLLQIVFHAQIAAENLHFDMNDIVAGITKKMIRRHPHVFGSVTVKDSSEVLLNWEKIKSKERKGSSPESLLSGVSCSLPALMRAVKLQEKAAGVGFDWPDYRGALEKTREELEELEAVISSEDQMRVERELGDLLFSVVNLARLLGVEPETALSETSVKFIRRFGYVEKMVRLAGRSFSQCTLAELDDWWEEAKKQEKI